MEHLGIRKPFDTLVHLLLPGQTPYLKRMKRAGFQTLPFLGCRLAPRSPEDKQLTPNPILKALLGFSWYFWFPIWCSEFSALLLSPMRYAGVPWKPNEAVAMVTWWHLSVADANALAPQTVCLFLSVFGKLITFKLNILIYFCQIICVLSCMLTSPPPPTPIN